MTQRLIASLLLLIFSISPLFSDTVALKSGQEYRNVKTVLGKSAVTISTDDGKTFSVPVAEIKFIKSSPVSWEKKVEEENALKPLPGPYAADIPVSSIYPKKRPEFSLLPLTGLIPVWSPAYQMDSSLGKPIGIFFSASELILSAALISQLSSPPKNYYSDAGNIMTSMYLLYPNLDFSQTPNFAALYYVNQNKHLVSTGGGRYTTRDQYEAEVDKLSSGLALLLFVDVVVNFVLPDFLWRRKPTPRDVLYPYSLQEGWRFQLKNQIRQDGEMLYHFGLSNHF